jgi:hypothetical protein
MASFRGVAHVRWELPFPLMLKPLLYKCWEPETGVAAFHPVSDVGSLIWSRKCGFLGATRIFGAEPEEPEGAFYPQDNYLVKSELAPGVEVPTLQLTKGRTGGFVEARPFCTINVYLCLRNERDHLGAGVLDRASAAINNVATLYRFFTMDPLARELDVRQDVYYTVVSLARVPKELETSPAEVVLDHLRDFTFSAILGDGRTHHIGMNSLDALIPSRIMEGQHLKWFKREAKSEHKVEIFQQLFLSAIRRIDRREFALSTVDAQSAFEAAVAATLLDILKAEGLTEDESRKEMANKGEYHWLRDRLEKLDAVAGAEAAKAGRQFTKFKGSPAHSEWNASLYQLRNDVVHGGRRSVDFAEAKRALVAGLNGVHALHTLSPTFVRPLSWSPPLTNMDHLKENAGRLFRVFEA